ncbi:hypothetical protein FKR81_40010 [Lentzea tibetensis]|uniref:Uncharacterized protein n=1 Tax=Lentzea tibetensis TaxID=2591470 RepID=A0A563EG23_9PSEU|nr:hypothetical protein [Lentzea tibetensis]TWP45147.1 hypothetical protein FKR81_40010 [Lentzea tibetensis]
MVRRAARARRGSAGGAAVDSVSGGFWLERPNRFVIVWPDLGQACETALIVLGQMVGLLERRKQGAKYLCVFGERI